MQICSSQHFLHQKYSKWQTIYNIRSKSLIQDNFAHSLEYKIVILSGNSPTEQNGIEYYWSLVIYPVASQKDSHWL